MNTKYYVFGETIYYTYDNLNRLSSVQYSTAGTENCTYDNAGNRLSKTNYNAAGGVTTVNISAVYTYDSLNRMTESLTDDIILAYKGRTTYQYDNSGSLLTETTTQLDYISEQVLETDLETGLPILPQIKSYSYNAFEQNISVTNADGSYQQIIYDARGLRISTIENGYRSDFVFDRGSVIAEFDGSGTLTSKNIRGYGLLAQKDDKGRLNYYLHNAHGDVTSLIDASGKVLNSYQYDDFGNTMAYAETVANRFWYAGEQFDKVTGQYYLRARYYDPQVGRFTQEDTYRGDGLNLYAYVANNPVNFVDPSGYCKDACETIYDEPTPLGFLEDVGESFKGAWDSVSGFFIGVGNWLDDIEEKQYQEEINATKEFWKSYEKLLKTNPDNPLIPYGFVSENDPNYEEAIKNAVEFRRQLERMGYISCGGLTLDFTFLPPPNLLSKAPDFVDDIAEGAGKTTREALLESATNQKLKNAIDQIYRPGATTGDGGLADAIRHQLATGELVG